MALPTPPNLRPLQKRGFGGPFPRPPAPERPLVELTDPRPGGWQTRHPGVRSSRQIPTQGAVGYFFSLCRTGSFESQCRGRNVEDGGLRGPKGTSSATPPSVPSEPLRREPPTRFPQGPPGMRRVRREMCWGGEAVVSLLPARKKDGPAACGALGRAGADTPCWCCWPGYHSEPQPGGRRAPALAQVPPSRDLMGRCHEGLT